MNIYECSLYERGTFSDTLENREFLFAINEDMAKQMFCNHNGYRKNKRGLEVKKIETVLAHRQNRMKPMSKTEWSEDYRCGGYVTTTWQEKACYCTNCKKETSSTSQLCTNCGAVFV